MFRKIIFLISIIVAANALNTFYSQGIREDGEKALLITLTTLFAENQVPKPLSIHTTFLHNVYTKVTYVTYEVFEVIYFFEIKSIFF